MLVSRLLDHFDTYTLLHVDVNAVRDQLVEMGIQDEIRFHFVRMDAQKIRGIIYRYTRHAAPYSDPIYCSEIIIANDMGDEDEYWKRLVAVKEMLHVADCVKISAETQDAVGILFKNFSLPPELRNDLHNGAKNTKSYLNDRIRIFLALAILIPAGCRAPIRILFQNKTLSEKEIADIAKIPERYVSVVMDENFDESITTFLEWERDNQT